MFPLDLAGMVAVLPEMLAAPVGEHLQETVPESPAAWVALSLTVVAVLLLFSYSVGVTLAAVIPPIVLTTAVMLL